MALERMVITAATEMSRRLPAALFVIAGIALMACAFALLYRSGQEERGEGGVEAPGMPEAAYASELPPTGRFVAELEYSCFGVPGDGEVSSNVLWDDDWFFNDERVYNHELARAASVLSALAYAESSYYHEGSDKPPYMENALRELGFSDVDSSSYRYRSEVVDEVIDVMTQQSDGVAYTLARKVVKPAGGVDGDARELIVVSVRGSYGSEWLSNFNLMEDEAGEAAAALADERLEDHSGYKKAALEILDALDVWRREAYADGRDVSILLTGHSRGGAVSGLLAAMLDDRQANEFEGGARDKVYAYTFASPRTTVSPRSNDARYGNIFNILNPADMVTRVPLDDWGYVRYGVDMRLPSIGEPQFEERYAVMSAAFTALTGEEGNYEPDAKIAIDKAVAEMARLVPTADEFLTPRGLAAVAAACALHINPVTILQGHYPSVYIAWMEALPAL